MGSAGAGRTVAWAAAGGGRRRTAEAGGGRRRPAEDGGGRQRTEEAGRGRRRTAEEDGGTAWAVNGAEDGGGGRMAAWAARAQAGWRRGRTDGSVRRRRTGTGPPMGTLLIIYTRVRVRAIRVLLLGFYRKLYTGEDKMLTHSGMRVKGWGVKLYTNCSPSLFLILVDRFFN